LKSKLVLAFAVISGTYACNKPSSTVMATIDPSPEVSLSQAEVEKIVNELRTKSPDKDQLLDAEAGLKASNYVSYEMRNSSRTDLLSEHSITAPGSNVITIHYSKGKHNDVGENISARIVCVYYINDKGQYAIDRILVEYVGKTYSA
jgi:hypothetical protein